ncbi:MAG: glycosyltransferase family 4 protein [Opitutus sp.]
MRILMLIQWCHPEPDFKCIPMACALRDRGHDVEVLTGFPNYPGGKVYPGYKIRPWSREVIQGIPVTRVALYPSHDSSAARRAANYGSFALSASLLGPWLTRRPDVVYAYNPMGLPAMVLRWLENVPFVYDIQDLWPDSLFASGMMSQWSSIEKLLGSFFKLVYRKASHLLVLSDGFKASLVARGVPANKVTVVYNWTNEITHQPQPADPALATRLGMSRRLNIIYTGNIGKAQALDVVLSAARQLSQTRPEVLFTLVGGGTEREALRQQAASDGLTNVQFLAAVPPTEISALCGLADGLLVHLRDEPLFRTTIPSKVQAYLATGKPLIAGVAGDARNLVERSGGGICFTPEKTEQLVDAVEQLCRLSSRERSEMGNRAAAFYRENLSIHVAAKEYERVFEAAIHGH